MRSSSGFVIVIKGGCHRVRIRWPDSTVSSPLNQLLPIHSDLGFQINHPLCPLTLSLSTAWTPPCTQCTPTRSHFPCTAQPPYKGHSRMQGAARNVGLTCLTGGHGPKSTLIRVDKTAQHHMKKMLQTTRFCRVHFLVWFEKKVINNHPRSSPTWADKTNEKAHSAAVTVSACRKLGPSVIDVDTGDLYSPLAAHWLQTGERRVLR